MRISEELSRGMQSRLNDVKTYMKLKNDGKIDEGGSFRYRPELKSNCVWLVKNGFKVKDLAVETGIHLATLHKWVKESNRQALMESESANMDGLFQVLQVKDDSVVGPTSTGRRIRLELKLYPFSIHFTLA